MKTPIAYIETPSFYANKIGEDYSKETSLEKKESKRPVFQSFKNC